MTEPTPRLPEEKQDEPGSLEIPAQTLPLIQRIPPIPFAIFALAFVFVLYQVVGGALTLIAFQGEISAENVNGFRWATLVSQILFILVPTIVLARLRYPAARNFFQLRVPDYKEVILSVIAVFALQQILQTYMLVQEAIPIPEGISKYVDMFKQLLEETYKILVVAKSPSEFFVVVLIVALTPAICEELFFRGLIQHAFEEATPGLKGALLAGFIFGVYHINPFTLIPLVALGTFFGFLVYRSANLTVTMSAHFFNNFVACVAIYMQLDEDFVAVAPGGNVSTADLVLNFGVFGVVFLVATHYFIRVTAPVTDLPEGD